MRRPGPGRACLLLAGILLAAPPARAGGEVLRTGWVPNPLLPQGQVQLAEADGGRVVNVVLHTRFMDRVVGRILGKEAGNWPGDHPDATAYRELLRAARADVRDGSDGGREALMISFVLGPGPGRVAWYTGPVENRDGILVMAAPRLLRSFAPSREYLERNAALVLEDSLGIPFAEARDLLAGPPPPSPGGGRGP